MHAPERQKTLPGPQHLFVQRPWTRHLTLLCLLVLISTTKTLSALSPGPAVTIVEAVPGTPPLCQQGADGADKPHLGKSLYVQGTVREGSHSRRHYHGPTQNVAASWDRLREVRSLA